MKKYYTLIVCCCTFPLMATYCKKESRYEERFVPAISADIPDTVISGRQFDVALRLRVADCERCGIQLMEQWGDTLFIKGYALKAEGQPACDTTKPFVEAKLPFLFGTQGKRYFRYEAVSGRLLDSVYVR